MPLPRSQTTTSLSGTRFDGPRPDNMPRRRASMYAQPQSAPISRSNSELSLHPPMRRRSLIQTPGVATRPQPGPTTARSTRSSLRHSHPPTPSMSRQPSTHFEESDCDFLSLAPLTISIDASRETSGLATPKDVDYSITGAFKFGTLRITNGSPVLTPNPALCLSHDAEPAKSGGKQKDYFAREAGSGGSETSGGNLDHTLASVQCESTFKIQDSQAIGDQKSRLEAVGEETTRGLSILGSEIPLEGQCTSQLQPSVDDKVQDPPLSPLVTQSRQAAVDDALFEDDTEASIPEVLDVRIDLSARSSPRRTVDLTQASEGVNRSDSGFVSNSKSDSSQSPSSLAKADSGYSSNVSLRSLRHGKNSATKEGEAGRVSTDSEQGSQRIQRSGSQRVLAIQVPGPVAVDFHAVHTPQSDRAPTPPPKDDLVLKKVSRAPSGVMDVRANPTMTGRMRRKSLHQQPAAIDTSQTLGTQGLKSPKALPLSPASVNSDGSSSSLSIANNSHKPRRLQRLLSLRNPPSPKQPYTVHETHSIDSKVPSIPKEVEAKLRERTGLYPMTTKRLALKTQLSKETLKTILSVGSLEYANDDDLSTSTCLEMGHGEDEGLESGGAKEHSLKQNSGSMPTVIKTAATMIPRKQSLARKPVPVREPQKRVEDQVSKEASLPVEKEFTKEIIVSSRLDCSVPDTTARISSPAPRPRRSMSMSTGHDHYLHLRTSSLPSSVPINSWSSSKLTPREGQPLPKHKTPPPISMVTRTSIRTPPPRSPSRPQGPAVPRKESSVVVARSASCSPALTSGRHLVHQGSVGGSQLDKSASISQLHLGTWDLSSSHSSVNRQTSSSVHSRQNSISSVRSDFVRESRGFQSHGPRAGGTALKHQSSLEGVGRRNQLCGVYAPQSAHQGPAFVHQSPSDGLHRHRNFQNSRPMSGQLPWGTPPYVPRDHHRRNLSGGSHLTHSGGSHAPYRILHSYNSPAYRNAPIWG